MMKKELKIALAVALVCTGIVLSWIHVPDHFLVQPITIFAIALGLILWAIFTFKYERRFWRMSRSFAGIALITATVPSVKVIFKIGEEVDSALIVESSAWIAIIAIVACIAFGLVDHRRDKPVFQLKVPLSPKEAEEFKTVAEKLGITPEELLRITLDVQIAEDRKKKPPGPSETSTR